MAPRRFPSPWTVHQTGGGCRVDDANGQAPAFVNGGDGEVAAQAKARIWDEARRIATGIAKLPELIGPSDHVRSDDAFTDGAG
jgi:hypothetical protein